MSDVYLEGLQNYLNGQEWRESIEIFVSANCSKYANVEEMTHEQHQLWKTFQEIVENILEMALQSIGGSIAHLERELSRISKQKSRGPRDETIKDVLERLLAFDSFHDFAHMMQREYQSQCHDFGNFDIAIDDPTKFIAAEAVEDHYVQPVNEENYNLLYQMGYEEDDIHEIMQTTDFDMPLDELVHRINEYLISPKPTHKKRTGGYHNDRYHETEAVQHDAADDLDYEYNEADFNNGGEGKHNEGPGAYHNTGTYDSSEGKEQWEELPDGLLESEDNTHTNRAPRYLLSFIEELTVSAAVPEEQPVDVNELHAKFIMAESVLDTFDAATSESSADIIKLLTWAKDMNTLHKDVQTVFNSEKSGTFSEFRKHNPSGLVQWYRNLEASRKDIDEHSIGGNIISDSEIARMVELDNIAKSGTEDEKYLHTLISRHDTVVKETRGMHFKLNTLINANRKLINRENIEELYLYLKQQVANNIELDLIIDDLYEHIHNLISGAKGIELVNLLLDLHILEDEQYMLKRKIQTIVGADIAPRQTAGNGEEGKHGDGSSGAASGGMEVSDFHRGLFGEDGEFPLLGDLETQVSTPYITSPQTSKAALHADSKHSGDGPFSASSKFTFPDVKGGGNEWGEVDIDGIQVDAGSSLLNAAASGALSGLAAGMGPGVSAASHVANGVGSGFGPKDAMHSSGLDSRAEAKHSSSGVDHLTNDHSDARNSALSNSSNAGDSKSDGAIGNSNSSTGGNTSSITASATATAKFAHDEYLNSLKDQHKAALVALKSSLEGEKSRRLKELEDRLARRKMKIKSLGTSEEAVEEYNALCEIQQGDIAALEAEIEATTAKYNNQVTSMVSGYKKKCLNELKSVRAYATENNLKACVPLPNGAKSDANKDIAAQLLSRFERDTQLLLDTIEHDRLTQRNKLLLALSKRKAEYNVNNVNNNDTKNNKMLTRLEEKTANDIDRLNANTNEQVNSALAEMQTGMLNSLAAIYMDDDLLNIRSNTNKGEGKDEDDDYLSDSDKPSGGSNCGKFWEWFNRVETIQDNYLAASKQIQYKLNSINSDNITVADETYQNVINQSSYNETLAHIALLSKEDAASEQQHGVNPHSVVTTQMLKVITDAYHTNLQDDEELCEIQRNAQRPGYSSASSKSRQVAVRAKEGGNKGDKEDLNRVKLGLMEEYEKSRNMLNSTLSDAQHNSKARVAALRARRDASRNAQSKDSDSSASQVVATVPSVVVSADNFETLIDTFLENPLSSETAYKLETLEVLVKNKPTHIHQTHMHSNKVTHSYGEEDERDAANRERIKNIHNEKEKVLTEDLYANMLSKKRRLEDRLRAKREELERNARQGAFLHDTHDRSVDEILQEDKETQERELREKMETLEKAFAQVSHMLKTASKDELSAYNLKDLIVLMEEKTLGDASDEQQEARRKGPFGGGNALVKRAVPKDIDMLLEDKESSGSSKHNSPNKRNAQQDDTFAENQPMVSHKDTHHNSALPVQTPRSMPTPRLEMGKEEIAGEARRISHLYNEETQKNDLMMKIQETRQRQALQRKLLERKLNQQNIAPAAGGGGAGYSSSMTFKDINEDLIGPKGARMLKAPSNLQPVFKNVDATTVVNNDLNRQKSYQSRGLNLGPMSRK